MVRESAIFMYELRGHGLPTDEIDGNEQESVLDEQDEKDWYVLECLSPEEVPAFIKLLSTSWHMVGAMSRTNYDSSDDDD